jgi:hypothetical protein
MLFLLSVKHCIQNLKHGWKWSTPKQRLQAVSVLFLYWPDCVSLSCGTMYTRTANLTGRTQKYTLTNLWWWDCDAHSQRDSHLFSTRVELCSVWVFILNNTICNAVIVETSRWSWIKICIKSYFHSWKCHFMCKTLRKYKKRKKPKKECIHSILIHMCRFHFTSFPLWAK